MKLSIAYSEKAVLKRIKEEVDIIVLADRLFGFYVFTTNTKAMEGVYSLHRCDEAVLDQVSWFFIPIVTLKELLTLLQSLSVEIA